MRIRLDRSREESLLEQARAQILSALHAGLVRRGDRLPSLRHVARLSGLNVKTVMQVYARLEREGLLSLRRGSGAYVRTPESIEFEPEQAVVLARLLRRHLGEAAGQNLDPGSYERLLHRFVTREAIPDRSVAVIECNEEQVNVFARELHARIGVKAHPVLLSDLARDGARAGAAVRGASLIAVTDFHRSEGEEIARRYGRMLVRLRLRGDFVPALMDASRRGRLVMIVSHMDFFPAFRRALHALGLRKEELDRITAVSVDDRPALKRALARADSAYISPLCPEAARRALPPNVRRLTFNQHLAAESIEAIEASLLLSGTLDGSQPAEAGRRRPAPR